MKQLRQEVLDAIQKQYDYKYNHGDAPTQKETEMGFPYIVKFGSKRLGEIRKTGMITDEESKQLDCADHLKTWRTWTIFNYRIEITLVHIVRAKNHLVKS